jgi:hypothetical protein
LGIRTPPAPISNARLEHALLHLSGRSFPENAWDCKEL